MPLQINQHHYKILLLSTLERVRSYSERPERLSAQHARVESRVWQRAPDLEPSLSGDHLPRPLHKCCTYPSGPPSVPDALSALTQVAPQDSKQWAYENHLVGNKQAEAEAHPRCLSSSILGGKMRDFCFSAYTKGPRQSLHPRLFSTTGMFWILLALQGSS